MCVGIIKDVCLNCKCKQDHTENTKHSFVYSCVKFIHFLKSKTAPELNQQFAFNMRHAAQSPLSRQIKIITITYPDRRFKKMANIIYTLLGILALVAHGISFSPTVHQSKCMYTC